MKYLIAFFFLIILSCNGKTKINIYKPVSITKKIDSLKIKVTDLTLSEIPITIKVSKYFIAAKKWKDSDGENLLVIYRSNVKISEKFVDNKNEYDVEFYAIKYTKNKNQYKKVWTIYGVHDKFPFYATNLTNSLILLA